MVPNPPDGFEPPHPIAAVDRLDSRACPSVSPSHPTRHITNLTRHGYYEVARLLIVPGRSVTFVHWHHCPGTRLRKKKRPLSLTLLEPKPQAPLVVSDAKKRKKCSLVGCCCCHPHRIPREGGTCGLRRGSLSCPSHHPFYTRTKVVLNR
ncbi:hypothetical protein K456DRAFT_443018 [Colletotrichum gloeosporioides 23]|nr:hypothetical protein K456DRAFT_443018 [Colletotrichum gloeosporioides 23]